MVKMPIDSVRIPSRRGGPAKEAMCLPRAKLGGRAKTARPEVGDGKPRLSVENYRPDRRRFFDAVDPNSDPLALKRIGIAPARSDDIKVRPKSQRSSSKRRLHTEKNIVSKRSSKEAFEARLGQIEAMRTQSSRLKLEELKKRIVKTGWDLKLSQLEQIERDQAQALADQDSIWNRLHHKTFTTRQRTRSARCSTECRSMSASSNLSGTAPNGKRTVQQDTQCESNEHGKTNPIDRAKAVTARPHRVRRHPPIPQTQSSSSDPIDSQLKALVDSDCQLSLYHDFLVPSFPEKNIFQDIPDLNDIWSRPWRCKRLLPPPSS